MLKLPMLEVKDVERRSRSVIGQVPPSSGLKHQNIGPMVRASQSKDLNSDLEAVKHVSVSVDRDDEEESQEDSDGKTAHIAITKL